MMKKSYGVDSKGLEGHLYSLENINGMKVDVLDYGATIVGIEVPDKEGNMIDVVLGYDNTISYEKEGSPFFGATVGRNANRIGGASVKLNEVEYQLTKNDNGNNLHSGLDYFHTRLWDVKEKGEQYIVFSLFSPDGDQGYPGNVTIELTYRLSDDNELKLEYFAKTDADTIMNLTNHSYFNLEGHLSGDVLKQKVWLDADAFTRADQESIPTGEIVGVQGTPMDFRTEKEIGKEIEVDYEALNFGGGYDHNWVLNNQGSYALIGSLFSEVSGIKMQVYTDLPGVQLYTGNFLSENEIGKGNRPYGKRSGVCFETQFFPDAVHHDNFASPILKQGEEYRTSTAYRFINV